MKGFECSFCGGKHSKQFRSDDVLRECFQNLEEKHIDEERESRRDFIALCGQLKRCKKALGKKLYKEDKALKELKEIKRQLKEYGWHTTECNCCITPYEWEPKWECSCGWENIKRELIQAEREEKQK